MGTVDASVDKKPKCQKRSPKMQIVQQEELRLWMIIQEKGAEKVGGVWTGIKNSLGAKKHSEFHKNEVDGRSRAPSIR